MNTMPYTFRLPLPVRFRTLARAATGLCLSTAAFALITGADLVPQARAQVLFPEEGLDSVRAQKPIVAAHRWLILLDAGADTATMDASADLFKRTVKLEDWSKVVTNVRTTAGKTNSRTPRGCRFVDSIPGAPPGKYCHLIYLTHYEKRKYVSELVTLVLEGEHWKVCSYSMDKASYAANVGTATPPEPVTQRLDGTIRTPTDSATPPPGTTIRTSPGQQTTLRRTTTTTIAPTTHNNQGAVPPVRSTSPSRMMPR
ncbi:hypothetical protein DB346_07785 [Verrucomicrobia bacterium LW23]|nr:hypothetical protein DB346_07785 [Verrucomicrobia bacterium LW23]